MPHVREAVDGGAADAARRRVGGDELGPALLDREELARERVVLGVADLGTGEDVVEALVPAELVPEERGTLRRRAREVAGPLLGFAP